MIKDFFENHSESEQVTFLKEKVKDGVSLTDLERQYLNEYVSEDYALIGLIGLILDDERRIFLGTLQPFDQEINQLCMEQNINIKILEQVANDYLDDNFNQAQEFVYRKLMSEFPKINKKAH